MAFPYPNISDQDYNSYLGELLSGADLRDRPNKAIELSGSEKQRFFDYVFQSYQSSVTRHFDWHRKLRTYRAVFELMKRKSSAEDTEATLFTAPGSSNKVTGVAAHMIEGIEQPELAVVSPMRSVKSLDDVAEICKRATGYLNREIEVGGSREVMAQDMPKESAHMGSAFSPLKLGDTPIDGEYFWQFSPLIPVEDVVIDNFRARNIWETNIYWLQLHIMNDLLPLADQGIIDPNEADKLYMLTSSIEESIQENFMGAGANNALNYQDDNAPLELAYGFYRFRTGNMRKSEYFYTIFEPNKRIGLAAIRSPYAGIADMPAMMVTRIGKMIGRFYGRGIIERLMPIQEMTDRELNNYLAASSWNASPPFEYKESSAFGQMLKRKGGKMRLMAGLGIPNLNDPKNGTVKTIDYNNQPGAFFGNMNLLNKFEEDATFTDAFLGQNDTRRTLGEFQISVNKGNLKVRLDFSDFAYDMNTNLKMFYSAMLYKIKHFGVVEVHEGGDLLAYKDIPLSQFDSELTNMLVQYANGGMTTPEEIFKALDQFSQRMLMGKIPGAKRSDINITLKGVRIIADKMGDFMRESQVLPVIGSWWQAAASDSKLRNNLKAFLESAGITEIDKRIPEDPNKNLDSSQVFSLLQPYLDYARSTSQV